MSVTARSGSVGSLARLRAATGPTHARLERRLDAVERLANPLHRRDLIDRFAMLHAPVASALEPHLAHLSGLDFHARDRKTLFGSVSERKWPIAFPSPCNTAEALGMMYVLEGSTLGGRFILQALTERGVDVSELAFLDPYGARTGERWRSFLGILERETADDERRVADACAGASAAFAHAERVLCGPTA
jgi:heme oxygenase